MNRNRLQTHFGQGGSQYSTFRPSYPEELFDLIFKNTPTPFIKAVDIGAGTGISTSSLSDRFDQVTAIEPDLKMLEAGTFAENVDTVNQCGEDVFFERNSYQLMISGNAFYWTDGSRLIPHIYKGLVQGGLLAAFRYDFPKVANENINEIIVRELKERWDDYRSPRLRDTEYTLRTIEKLGQFKEISVHHIENIVPLKPDELAGFFSSTSYVLAYLESLTSPEDYLTEFKSRLVSALDAAYLNVDFGLELVLAKK